MYKKLLIATDGSQVSMAAAQKGMKLAKLFGANLKILYVIDQRVFFFPHEVLVLAPENPYFTILEDLRKNAQKVMERMEAFAREIGVEFEPLVREGAVVDVIAETVKKYKIELLVIGAYGKTGETRGILGSTAQSIAATVPCSLLIERGK